MSTSQFSTGGDNMKETHKRLKESEVQFGVVFGQ